MKQRGVAVITALLVVALVTAATGFIAWRQQLWLRTVENQLNSVMAQAKGIARAATAAESLAAYFLSKITTH